MNKEIKKILLVVPPYTILRTEPKTAHVPLGLTYIAANIEKDYSVKILDTHAEGFNSEYPVGKDRFRYGLTFEEIAERIKDYQPEVVGVSCLFDTQSGNSHKVLGIAKSVNPQIITVMGGAHPSVVPEYTLQDQHVDYVIIGEADHTFPQFLNALKDGGIEKIDGIAYRQNSKININPKTSFIQSLDSLPFPARHLLNMDTYFKINQPMGSVSRLAPNTPLITSRGCPAQCIFCSIHSVWGRRFRPRSPQSVLDEIQFLIGTYGIREVQFEDDNLIFEKKRAIAIFDGMIERNFNLLWSTPNGVAAWALDEEILEKMKASGCYRITMGIESGDSYVLKNIVKKPLKLDIVKPLVKKIKQLGMETQAYFVVGFPGETKEQIKRTFAFARSLSLDYLTVCFATPRAGTDLYRIAIEKGYLKNPIDFDTLSVRTTSIETPDFSARELERIFARHYLIYALHSIIRNPFQFFKVMLRKLRTDPLFFYTFIKDMLLKKAF